MGRVNIVGLCCLISFLLCSVVCYSSSLNGHPISWCVARGDIPTNQLKNYLETACAKLDCREIHPGGSCYEPNTLQNHASYAIDLGYRLTGTCPSNIGTITLKQPIFGKCHYP